MNVPPPNKPVPVGGAGVEVLVAGLGGKLKRPLPTVGVPVAPVVVDEAVNPDPLAPALEVVAGWLKTIQNR